MESETTLIKVFIKETTKAISVRRNDFRRHQGKLLPGIELLLDGLAKKVSNKKTQNSHSEAKAMLASALINSKEQLCLAARKNKFDYTVPSSFSEACQYPGWFEAIDWVYNALMSRNTWTYVLPKPGVKPVPYTWVFKQKPLDAQGKKFLQKARCCLIVDQQLEYIDYNLYAPVASHYAIRLLICIAASEGLVLEGADVSNAYLYGDIDLPIIMCQPTDLSQKEAIPGYYCQLNKSLYGTKHAGKYGDHFLINLSEIGDCNHQNTIAGFTSTTMGRITSLSLSLWMI